MRLTITLFSFLIGNLLFAQGTFLDFKCKMRDANTEEPLIGAKLELIRNDSVIQTIYSDTAGKADFIHIPAQQKFDVKFHKEGYVSKLARFDLTYTEDDLLRGNVIQKGIVSLFPPLPHENFAFLDTIPLINFYFASPHTVQFYLTYKNWHEIMNYCEKGNSFDQSYQFLSLLDSAKNEIDQQEYSTALTYFETAVAIIDEVQTKEEYKELCTAARIYYQGELNKQYNTLIKQADLYFAEAEYEWAWSTYEHAYNIKKLPYPLEQIKACKKKLSSSK